MGNPPLRNVAILIFDEVEVLDFAGPFEVFSVTGRTRDVKPFNVYTVAEHKGEVLARNSLSVNPRCTIHDCPPADVVVIPGGWGTRSAMNNPAIINWIRHVAGEAELVLSVCTGALLLAKAGLLDGHEATTHHMQLELLAQTAPAATVLRARRYVDSGKIITAGGISAGIDMSLHVVARLLGTDAARETARYMEYAWDDHSPDWRA
jgi:transcriptional regulator GlxA family with amidase domain